MAQQTTRQTICRSIGRYNIRIQLNDNRTCIKGDDSLSNNLLGIEPMRNQFFIQQNISFSSDLFALLFSTRGGSQS